MKECSGLVAILTVLFAFTPLGGSLAVATEKVGEQEELACNVCHTDEEQSAETLTDQGLYYQYLRTLDGYDQVLERFESCTYCHDEVAGSKRMTPQGYRFQWMMEDMAGLRAWLEENHPRPQVEGDSASDPAE